MKKKILCGILFLAVLFCISFSQTHLTAANTNPPAENTSGTESASPEDAGTGLSDIDTAVSPDEQFLVDIDNSQIPSGTLPGLPSGATPAPLENTAASDGEYTLSLTTSIGTLTYYNQSDSRWADYLYGGTDPLSVYGCGPTVMAMLVTSFTENTCQPPDMAAWAAANHYWSLGNGTKHEFIPEGAAAFGLHAESFQNLTAEGVISELKNGHILVALMGPGHFSDSGHFIIITDDWSGNQVRVADPARLERTQAAWDVQIILDELLTNSTAGGPVWSITPK